MLEDLKIAVFASGKGSNLNAIINAINNGMIPNTQIVCVISNNSDSGALQIGKNFGISSYHISRKQFISDDKYNTAIMKVLESHNTNFIVLAGYMKLLDTSIVQRYRNRILNIHPALLPKYGGKGMYGRYVHEKVLACGEKYSGVTVHIVDEEYDHGPIVLQVQVEISDKETPESLERKIQNLEHKIYPEAIKLFAEGRVKVENQIVKIYDRK